VALKILILFILIHIVSFVLRSPILLNIHNQGQSISLTSPVYFIHNGKWHIAPDQEIDINTMMSNRIEFDSRQDILEGALVYRIQKKKTSFLEKECGTHRKRAKIDKSIQDESKYIQLLVAWRVEHTELHVRVLLVEHDRELDEDKLKKLHQKCWHLFNAWVDPIENEWLLDNAKKLKTKIKAMNGGYRWDIFIHETEGYYERRSFWIDTTR
jgi:hypothetical protein